MFCDTFALNKALMIYKYKPFSSLVSEYVTSWLCMFNNRLANIITSYEEG